MKRIVRIIIIGMVFLTIPSFVFAAIEEDYYKSFIDKNTDGYIYFGNDKYPSNKAYDININVDESSTSSQWVNIGVTVAHDVIENRGIEKFYILANGKIVDTFYPALYQNKLDEIVYRGYYEVKPSITELIGTNVFFQIVGVHNEDAIYEQAVAWSGISDIVTFDDLPVYDKIAVGWLEQIYYKLKELLNAINSLNNVLANLLTKLTKTIENMFTPSEQAMTRFEDAKKNLFEATPIDDIQNEMQGMTDALQEQKEHLQAGVDENTEVIVFGEKRDWFGFGTELYLFNLTDFKEEIMMFRELLSAILWIEFFFFLTFYLSPKLNI